MYASLYHIWGISILAVLFLILYVDTKFYGVTVLPYQFCMLNLQ